MHYKALETAKYISTAWTVVELRKSSARKFHNSTKNPSKSQIMLYFGKIIIQFTQPIVKECHKKIPLKLQSVAEKAQIFLIFTKRITYL